MSRPKLIRKIIVNIVLNGLALYAAVTFLSQNITYTGGVLFFILGGLIIGLLNTFLKPLLKIVSLPFIIITAGLFLLVINTGILWLTEKMLNSLDFHGVSLHINGLFTYVMAALIFAVVNWVEHLFIRSH